MQSSNEKWTTCRQRSARRGRCGHFPCTKKKVAMVTTFQVTDLIKGHLLIISRAATKESQKMPVRTSISKITIERSIVKGTDMKKWLTTLMNLDRKPTVSDNSPNVKR